MMRAIKYLLLALANLVVLLSVAVTWLVQTTSGTQFLLQQVGQWVPELAISDARGTLAQRLHIGQLSLQQDAFTLHASDLHLSVAWWPLLDRQQLLIESIGAQDLRIATRSVPSGPSPSVAPATALPTLPHWLNVQVNSLQLATLTVDNQQVKALDVQLGLHDQHLTLGHLQAAYQDLQLDMRGTVHGVSPYTADFSLQWQHPQTEGALHITGPLQQPRVDLSAQASEPGVDLRSTGTLDFTHWPTLAAVLTHNITLRTDAAAKALVLQTDIQGQQPQWHTSLAATYDGYKAAAHVYLDASDDRLHLELREGNFQQALSFSGQYDLQQQRGQLRVLPVAPERLVPGLQTAGDIVLELTPQRLDITVDLRDTAYADLQVPSAMGHIQLTQAAPVIIDGALQIRSVVHPQLELEDIALRIQGTQAHTDYDLRWQGGHLSGALEPLTPAFHMDPQANIRLSDQLTLTNDRAIQISRDGDRWQLNAHCWLGLGQWCVDGMSFADDGRLETRGHFSDLSASLLPASLRPPLDLQFTVAGAWHLQGRGQQWQGDAQLQSDTASVLLPSPYPENTRLSLADLAVSATLTDDTATVTVQGDAHGQTLQVSLRALDLFGRPAIQGSGELSLDLAKLPLPELITTLEGPLHTQIAFRQAGSELSFSVDGGWDNGRIATQVEDVRAEQIDLKWHAEQNGWQLRGTAIPGQGGTLALDASGDFQPVAQLSLQGEAVPVLSPFGTLTVTPRLQAELQSTGLTLGGEVQIPSARIVIQTLPASLPKPSRDVVVVGREPDPEPEQTGGVTGTVNLSLGDDVRVAAMGVDVGLRGTLNAMLDDNDLEQLNGTLFLYDGSLSAAGQTLNINEGQIVFSGDPDDPYIDVKAIRAIENRNPPLTVGVRVQGHKDQLETTIFSEPSMREARALSYLVFGRDLDSSAKDANGQLMLAAMSLGLNRANSTVRELGRLSGLDQLSAMATEQKLFAIVAGRQITPRLHVRYHYSALAATGALVITYYLNNRWRLEASNEDSSAMDILYNLGGGNPTP